MEIESCSWHKDGLYFLSHLFGGIMISCALLRFFTKNLPKMPHLLRGSNSKKPAKKKVRVYIDGCFDLMHYGHANALRQAKALGDELVVGVASDEEIILYKGPPVLSMQERLTLVNGLKWVDEVIPDVPYVITEDFMNVLFNEYKIDYIVHGDDPCILSDGTDAYGLAKKAGRYKQIKRTEGVSSTDIVGRILSSADYVKKGKVSASSSQPTVSDEFETAKFNKSLPNSGHISHFLPTSRRISQFSSHKAPGPNSRVVYIDGAFDLFHAGHVKILKKAKQLGDFLLVGLYADQTVSWLRGDRFPLMNLLERSLSVLACQYVDDIIIGAPFAVTKDMISTFNISLVVRGSISEDNNPLLWDGAASDPYDVPKGMGIFRNLESPEVITTSSIAERIIANHEIYLKRNAKKEKSEKQYYAEKKYVAA
ncbi:hypothetical protein M569_10547, partial [Genlisea aurea]